MTPPPHHSPHFLSGRGGALRVILASAYVFVLSRITLTSAGAFGGADDAVMQLCVLCGSRGAGDAVLNIVLFLPLGMLLGVRWRSLTALAVGLALSTTIEFVQLGIDGRSSNVGDILWNGCGTGLGALVSRTLRRWLSPGARLRRARLVTGGLPLLYLVLAAISVQPTGTAARYYGQWTPDLAFMPQYRGDVLMAALDGHPVPEGGPYDDDLDPRAWLAGDWTLRARVEMGPPPTAVAPIVSIYDGDSQEILLLGAHGTDLVLRERTLGDGWRMDRPDLRWNRALAGREPGAIVTVEARRRGHDRCLGVDDVLRCGLGFTPGDTWGLLMFLEGVSPAQRTAISVAWMGTLFFLLGLVGGPPRWVLVAAAGAGVLILPIVAFSRLLAPPPLEWLGFVLGVAAGAGFRPFVRLFLGLPAGRPQPARSSR